MNLLYRDKRTSFLSVVLAACVAGLLTVLAANNLGYSGMWWDEAVQFWIAQGLSSYSEPFSDPAGLPQVIRYNNSQNLDPGGFSILLHWWSIPGKSLAVLRTLPFLFLPVAMLSLGLLAWRWTRNRLFAVSAIALPLCYSGITYFSFEIRAYSMEMAGLAVCTLLFAGLLDKPALNRALLLGIASALFMASRYSFVLFVLALGLAYLQSHRMTGQPFDAAARLRFMAFALPVIMAGALCFYVTTRYQLWPEMRISGAGIAAPVYTRPYTLLGSEDVAALITRNLFSPAALPITGVFLWLMFLRTAWYRRWIRSDDNTLAAFANRRFIPVYNMIVLLLVFSILSSLLGAYPWDIASRWSAYLLMVSAISVLTLGAEILVGLQAQRAAGPGRTGMSQAAVFAAIFVLGVYFLGSVNALSHKNDIESVYRTNVAPQLDQLPTEHLPSASVFVAYYEIPILRYLYEFGPYAGRAEYPRVFRFESRREFRRKTAIDASAEGLEYVISAWTPDYFSLRLPAYRTENVNGTRLRKLLCPAGGPVTHCN